MSNVKVAVRVRPLSKREVDRNAKTVVETHGDNISITNVKVDGPSDFGDSRERVKHFTFDYCYDSTGTTQSLAYTSQQLVFQDLGTEVLQAAFEGYNACVLAYGQTSTGKTYTMMGSQEEQGLIPRICEGLFSHVDDFIGENVTFRVNISYLEIYNERVRDLLRPSLVKQKEKYTLKVREHPKEGPYVQDLSNHTVKDNVEIQDLLERGNENRTTASTYMHDHSSRSHAIVTISFTQAKLEDDLPHEVVSKIHLVDLAGSERADPTFSANYKGRLKEGANINKSLVTLGNVIKALAEKSLLCWSTDNLGSTQSVQSSSAGDTSTSSFSSPKRNRLPYIPYRDSVLTWLLKDSLGGNSKTIMICTITPASIYYNETISTLRYAQRAKSIVNKPKINEDTNVTLIRDLRREIERLREMLKSAHLGLSQLSIVEMHDMQVETEQGDTVLSLQESGSSLAETLQGHMDMANQLTQTWKDKWTETHHIMKESDLSIRGLKHRTSSMGVLIESQMPHLVGMDDDILSTGVAIYHLKEGKTLVGRDDAQREQDIVLSGPAVNREHCFFKNVLGTVILYPNRGGHCAINGIDCKGPTRLKQGDYILLGKTNMFRFNNPAEAAKLRERRKSLMGSEELLSHASSYDSLDTVDSDCYSQHGMRSFYSMLGPNLQLERQYQTESERINQAKKELELLREEHQRAEEQRREKEEELWRIHEQHRAEIQREKELVSKMVEETQIHRQKAESDLAYARECIQKEKDAFYNQLEKELEKLKNEQKNSKHTPEAEAIALIDVDISHEAAAKLAKEIIARKRLSFEGHLKDLVQGELITTLHHRETEENIRLQSEDLEDQYEQSQQEIERHLGKIKEIEEGYRNEDANNYQEITDKNSRLEDIEEREIQLELYIEQKQDLLQVGSAKPQPLRTACSEEVLTKFSALDPEFPTRTSSLQTLERGSEGDIPSLSNRLSFYAVDHSIDSVFSGSSESMDFSVSSSTSVDSTVKDKKTAASKSAKLTSVAKNVTDRLYKAPPPKFRREPKTGSAASERFGKKDRDDKKDDKRSREVKKVDRKHGETKTDDKTHKKHDSVVDRKIDSSRRKREITVKGTPPRESPSRQISPTKTNKDSLSSSSAAKKGAREPKGSKQKVTAVQSSVDRSDSPCFQGTRTRKLSPNSKCSGDQTLNNGRMKVPRLRHVTSASSLANVPEAIAEEAEPIEQYNFMQSEPNIPQVVVRRRKKKSVDEDEFRRHSEPSGEKLAEAFEKYTQEVEQGVENKKSGLNFVENVSQDNLVFKSNVDHKTVLYDNKSEIPSVIVTREAQTDSNNSSSLTGMPYTHYTEAPYLCDQNSSEINPVNTISSDTSIGVGEMECKRDMDTAVLDNVEVMECSVSISDTQSVVSNASDVSTVIEVECDSCNIHTDSMGKTSKNDGCLDHSDSAGCLNDSNKNNMELICDSNILQNSTLNTEQILPVETMCLAGEYQSDCVNFSTMEAIGSTSVQNESKRNIDSLSDSTQLVKESASMNDVSADKCSEMASVNKNMDQIKAGSKREHESLTNNVVPSKAAKTTNIADTSDIVCENPNLNSTSANEHPSISEQESVNICQPCPISTETDSPTGAFSTGDVSLLSGEVNINLRQSLGHDEHTGFSSDSLDEADNSADSLEVNKKKSACKGSLSDGDCKDSLGEGDDLNDSLEDDDMQRSGTITPMHSSRSMAGSLESGIPAKMYSSSCNSENEIKYLSTDNMMSSDVKENEGLEIASIAFGNVKGKYKGDLDDISNNEIEEDGGPLPQCVDINKHPRESYESVDKRSTPDSMPGFSDNSLSSLGISVPSQQSVSVTEICNPEDDPSSCISHDIPTSTVSDVTVPSQQSVSVTEISNTEDDPSSCVSHDIPTSTVSDVMVPSRQSVSVTEICKPEDDPSSCISHDIPTSTVSDVTVPSQQSVSVTEICNPEDDPSSCISHGLPTSTASDVTVPSQQSVAVTEICNPEDDPSSCISHGLPTSTASDVTVPSQQSVSVTEICNPEDDPSSCISHEESIPTSTASDVSKNVSSQQSSNTCTSVPSPVVSQSEKDVSPSINESCKHSSDSDSVATSLCQMYGDTCESVQSCSKPTHLIQGNSLSSEIKTESEKSSFKLSSENYNSEGSDVLEVNFDQDYSNQCVQRVKPSTRTLGVSTSPELMPPELQNESFRDEDGAPCSDDSLAEAKEQLLELQEALEKEAMECLPPKGPSGNNTQLSSARKAARQRAMISRKNRGSGESDGGDQVLDESLLSGNQSKSSSRPGSASKRRRKVPVKSTDKKPNRKKRNSSEEYINTTDSDIIYSDNSVGKQEKDSCEEDRTDDQSEFDTLGVDQSDITLHLDEQNSFDFYDPCVTLYNDQCQSRVTLDASSDSQEFLDSDSKKGKSVENVLEITTESGFAEFYDHKDGRLDSELELYCEELQRIDDQDQNVSSEGTLASSLSESSNMEKGQMNGFPTSNGYGNIDDSDALIMKHKRSSESYSTDSYESNDERSKSRSASETRDVGQQTDVSSVDSPLISPVMSLRSPSSTSTQTSRSIPVLEISPMSVWCSGDKGIKSPQKASSSHAVKTPTEKSAKKRNKSKSVTLEVMPPEVWSSEIVDGALDVQMGNYGESDEDDNSYSMETESITPQTPTTSSNRFFEHGKFVLQDPPAVRSVPLKYEITVKEEEINVSYNVDRREYRTYGLQSQPQNDSSMRLPDSININLTDTTTHRTENHHQSTARDWITLCQGDLPSPSSESTIVSEKNFRRVHDFSVSDSGTDRENSVERKCVNEESKHFVECTNDTSKDPVQLDQVQEGAVKADSLYSPRESDTTSDYGTMIGEGRKGNMSFYSDSGDELDSISSNSRTPRDEQCLQVFENVEQSVTSNLQNASWNQVGEQTISDLDEERLELIPANGEQICKTTDSRVARRVVPAMSPVMRSPELISNVISSDCNENDEMDKDEEEIHTSIQEILIPKEVYDEIKANQLEDSLCYSQNADPSLKETKKDESTEEGQTESDSSIYKTPQQSPRGEELNGVHFPNNDKDPQSQIYQRKQNAKTLSREQLPPLSLLSPVKGSTLKTVSVNTDTQEPIKEVKRVHHSVDDNSVREDLKRELQQKIARLQRHVRSRSDSAISSDYTDGDSTTVSPRGSRLYDSDKTLRSGGFGNIFVDPCAINIQVMTTQTDQNYQSSLSTSKVLDIDNKSAKKSPFKDSGNICDGEDNYDVAGESDDTEPESVNIGIMQDQTVSSTEEIEESSAESERSLSPGEVVLENMYENFVSGLESMDRGGAKDYTSEEFDPTERKMLSQTFKEKSPSLSDLKTGQQVPEDIRRSMSENCIDQFEENDTDDMNTTSSNDSIVFVFMGQCHSKESMEQLKTFTSNQPGYKVDLASSNEILEDEYNQSEKDISPAQSEEICPESSHSDEKLEKNTIATTSTNTDLDNDENSDEQLRHKFGIDENILPIPTRSMSADNLPKQPSDDLTIHRSRSAGMLNVGVIDNPHDPSNNEGIFPPCVDSSDMGSQDYSESRESSMDSSTMRNVSMSSNECSFPSHPESSLEDTSSKTKENQKNSDMEELFYSRIPLTNSENEPTSSNYHDTPSGELHFPPSINYGAPMLVKGNDPAAVSVSIQTMSSDSATQTDVPQRSTELNLSEETDNWYNLSSIVIENIPVIESIKETLTDSSKAEKRHADTKSESKDDATQTGLSLQNLASTSAQTESHLYTNVEMNLQTNSTKAQPSSKRSLVVSEIEITDISPSEMSEKHSVANPALNGSDKSENDSEIDYTESRCIDQSTDVPVLHTEKFSDHHKTKQTEDKSETVLVEREYVFESQFEYPDLTVSNTEMEALKREHEKMMESIKRASEERKQRTEQLKANIKSPLYRSKEQLAETVENEIQFVNVDSLDTGNQSKPVEMDRSLVDSNENNEMMDKTPQNNEIDESALERTNSEGKVWQMKDVHEEWIKKDTIDRVSKSNLTSESQPSPQDGINDTSTIPYRYNPREKEDRHINENRRISSSATTTERGALAGLDFEHKKLHTKHESRPTEKEVIDDVMSDQEPILTPPNSPVPIRDECREDVIYKTARPVPLQSETIISRLHDLDRKDTNRSPLSNRNTHRKTSNSTAMTINRVSTGVEAAVDISDDFTQTDFRFDQNDSVTESGTSVLDQGNDRMREELDRLQKERIHIIDLLSLNYLPASLTVELLEAKLNYCIGQTDLLLQSLEDNWEDSEVVFTKENENHFYYTDVTREYLTKYRKDLQQSKKDIEICRERMDRKQGTGRGRSKGRNSDYLRMKRRAEIETFNVERMLEQQNHEMVKRMNTSPLKRGNPMFQDDKLERYSRSASPASPLTSPRHMTPKQHKDHLISLRKEIVKHTEEEEFRHRLSRSNSPCVTPRREEALYSSPRSHSAQPNTYSPRTRSARLHDHNLAYSPSIAFSVPDDLPSDVDYGVSTYLVPPGNLNQPRSYSTEFSRPPSNTLLSPTPLDSRSLYSPELRGRSLSPRPSSERMREPPSFYGNDETRQLLREMEEAREQNLREISRAQRTLNSYNRTNIRTTSSDRDELPSMPWRPYSSYSDYASQVLHDTRQSINGILSGSYELYDGEVSRITSGLAARSVSPTSSIVSGDLESLPDSVHSGHFNPLRTRPVRSTDIKAKLQRQKLVNRKW